MTINIEYDSEISLDIDYKDIINKVILKSSQLEKCIYEIEVNVLLTDNNTVQELNKKFRNIDSTTDVLSFPMVEYEIPGEFLFLEEDSEDHNFNPETGELILGDVVISVEKVIDQANEYGHSVTRELAFLLAHSMLHLFGYDHMEENEALIMENKQENVLQELNIGRV